MPPPPAIVVSAANSGSKTLPDGPIRRRSSRKDPRSVDGSTVPATDTDASLSEMELLLHRPDDIKHPSRPSLIQSLRESASKTWVAHRAAYKAQPEPVEPPQHDRIAVIVFTILAFCTRYFRIASGKWDEAHFGKFGSHYLKGTFYFDVHPPLGKMLVGLAGWAAGYNGTYEFTSGQNYPDWVNYVGMRMFLSSFSALAVPFSYMTAVQLGLKRPVAYLVGLMTLLDVGFIGIGRLVLLDAMLIFFTTTTTFYYTLFRNQEGRPFSFRWWSALLMTGVSIGCVSSVKWVGFFVTALVGLLTIEELWSMLGNVKVPKMAFVKHFTARALCLIAVPIAIYIGSFYVHFSILRNSGPGDANMSSLFQASLKGNELSSSPVDVAFGSIVSIKNNAFGGGLLHSHVQTYPGGSKQQQVTCYHHKDLNNDWRIMRSYNYTMDYDNDPIELVRNGDIIRLNHLSTGRNLHSHTVEAPVTKSDFEVSGYGNWTLHDPNDLWVVEIARSPGQEGQIKSLFSQFRLRHYVMGCYLRAKNTHLPEWGFKQIEVSCEKRPSRLSDRSLLWNIESQKNERLPKGDPTQYRSSFWKDLTDCNVGMYLTNNALTPNPDHEPSIITSLPKHWWWMRKGIRMSSWDSNKTKFFMLGTPTVWWGGSLATVLLAVAIACLILLNQRRMIDLSQPKYQAFFYQAKVALGGWALHYLPFFAMGRVTYVHHYYPALVYGVLCFGLLTHYAVRGLSPRWQYAVVGGYAALTLVNYVYFAPMAYGIEGPAVKFKGRQWLKSWNLY